MTKNTTHIKAVVDRSGSMSSISRETCSGFDGFIREQCTLPGRATVSVTQFDNKIEQVYGPTDIQSVPPLTHSPRGTTALYDAVGQSIVETANYIHSLRKPYRPERVLFLIVTDGYENASREYTQDHVKELIAQKREEGWEFVFHGANIDVAEVSKGMNIMHSQSFQANAAGVKASWSNMSRGASTYRMSGSYDPDTDVSKDDVKWTKA